MALYDRKFEILNPTLDRLIRRNWEVANPALLDPSNSLCLIDGEFMQLDSSYKLIRSADAAKPSFALIEDRGDYGVQVHKRPATVIGTYIAQTLVYATAIAASPFGTKLEVGTVNKASLGGVNRAGLVLQTAGLVVGYIMKPASADGQPLEFISTLA
jgi:hypothetical protein